MTAMARALMVAYLLTALLVVGLEDLDVLEGSEYRQRGQLTDSRLDYSKIGA